MEVIIKTMVAIALAFCVLSSVVSAAQPDFVTGNLLGKVELFASTDSGGFCSCGIIKDVGDHAWGLASGDYNGDGYRDFIVGDYDGQVELFTGPDFASAGIIVIADVGDEAYGLASGDYDSDGDIDFVVGDRAGELELFLNNGTGGFSSAGIITDVGMNAWGLTGCDFDGDGDCDFVAGDYDGVLKLFKNDGTANFSSTTIEDIGSEAYGITSGDYDGDGDCDLLATANDGNVTLFRNDGAGNFTNCGTVISLGSYRYGLESNDFDADGDIDVLAETANETISLYKNDGNGNFAFDSVVAYPGTQPRGLTSDDFVMPDLTVTQIKVPAAVYGNVSNVISATIENIGNEKAMNFNITLYADGSEIETETVSSLNAGASADISFLWTPAHTGAYMLRVMADPDNVIPEFDESNNEREQAVTVVEGAVFPPTPFYIYGWVFNTTNQPLLNPDVTVKNLNTSEEYDVETKASSNFYQVIISSCNVSAGNVLKFNASDGVNSTNYTVTVTPQDMTDGGLFEQNISLYQAPGICGDIDDSGDVGMADYFLLVDYIAEVPGRVPANMWAADVDCSGDVGMADYFLLVDYIAEVPGRVLHCC